MTVRSKTKRPTFSTSSPSDWEWPWEADPAHLPAPGAGPFAWVDRNLAIMVLDDTVAPYVGDVLYVNGVRWDLLTKREFRRRYRRVMRVGLALERFRASVEASIGDDSIPTRAEGQKSLTEALSAREDAHRILCERFEIVKGWVSQRFGEDRLKDWCDGIEDEFDTLRKVKGSIL